MRDTISQMSVNRTSAVGRRPRQQGDRLVDPLELQRFKSVLDAARTLSEGTYSGTVTEAHERK